MAAASEPVRTVDQHLTVEPAGAQKRGVQNLGPVGRGQQHEPGRRIEPVELGQELVQGLLLLVMPAAARIEPARPAERIQLVDEDDGGRLLAGLLEQIAHARRADADEHLDEFRAADGEERHARLAGHRPGQSVLPVPGGPTSRMPLGIRAPSAPCSSGSLRKLTIS